jgi:hypothetical protein
MHKPAQPRRSSAINAHTQYIPRASRDSVLTMVATYLSARRLAPDDGPPGALSIDMAPLQAAHALRVSPVQTDPSRPDRNLRLTLSWAPAVYKLRTNRRPNLSNQRKSRHPKAAAEVGWRNKKS